MEANRSKNISLVGVVFLLAAVAIVLAVPPAAQYELSLYRAYPAYFWALVIGALFAGLLAIGVSVSAKTSGDRSWVFGLLILFMIYSMLLLMPFIRGYRMYGGGDSLSHLGFVKEIAMSGGISGNVYPPTHLLALVLVEATGADLMTIAMLIPVVFSGLYFGAMFYLLDHLFDRRDRFLFGLIFALLPILGRAHLGFRPYDLSIMFVPLVIYLFVKSHRFPLPSVRSAFVVVLVALLLYHPLTALFMIGVFSLYLIGKYLPWVRRPYATPTNLLSLSVAIFVVWYTNSTRIILRFNDLYKRLLGLNTGDPPIEAYTQTVEEASPALIDLFRVAAFKYGVEFVLLGLGFVFVGLALVLWLREEYVPDTYTTMFTLVMLLFTISGGLFFVKKLFASPDRPLQIAKIGAVVLVGLLFTLVWDRVESTPQLEHFRTGISGVLTVLILLLVFLTVFSFYPSPLESSSNPQVTEMNLAGSAWLTQHGTAAEQFSEFGYNYRRYFHALYGIKASKPFSEKDIPNHFNYEKYKHLGQSYEKNTYLVITRKGRIVYPKAFSDYREHWRFTPEDFDRLERDRTTTRIYDNGDNNQYLIDGNA